MVDSVVEGERANQYVRDITVETSEDIEQLLKSVILSVEDEGFWVYIDKIVNEIID